MNPFLVKSYFMKRRGFTLVELLVTFAIVAVVLSLLWQIFSSGVRGSQFTQETIDHIRDSAILFRAIDKDIQRMVPWAVCGSSGRSKGGAIECVSTDKRNCEMSCWIRTDSDFHHIRYTFTTISKGKYFLREVLNSVGNTVKSESYGGAMIDNVSICDPSGKGDKLKITVVFCSKLKKHTVFERVFSIGTIFPDDARHWVYD